MGYSNIFYFFIIIKNSIIKKITCILSLSWGEGLKSGSINFLQLLVTSFKCLLSTKLM